MSERTKEIISNPKKASELAKAIRVSKGGKRQGVIKIGDEKYRLVRVESIRK